MHHRVRRVAQGGVQAADLITVKQVSCPSLLPMTW